MEDDDLSETEVEAVHQVELGLEWLHRAHGALVQFHHNTGHAMDHLDDAAELLAEAGHDDLADQLQNELLPKGVLPRDGDEGWWTYEVIEGFESQLYDDIRAFETETREQVSDGERHPAEQRQQESWRSRAAGDSDD